MANKRFIVTDEAVLNTYGFRVLSAGIQFPPHVPAFDNHKTEEDPVGHWVNFKLESGQWTAEFVPNLATARGKEIADMVEGGHLGQASLGLDLRTVKASSDPSLMLPGQKLKTVTACVVPEISVVGMASNRNAVALYDGESQTLLNLSANDPSVIGALSNMIIELPIEKTKKNSMKSVFDFLKLSDGATEEDVLKIVKNLSAENTQLKSQLAATRATEIDSLLDNAIKDGRLSAKGRDHYKKVLESSFELGKTILESLEPKVKVNLADFANANGGGAGSDKAAFNGKTYAQLERENPGVLLSLKNDNPELFKLMYKQEYGIDWKD